MKKLLFISTLMLCLVSIRTNATVIFVDSSHVGGIQNGTSWPSAFSNFQSGINAANAGDSVWVAKGTYQPTVDSSFIMKEGVKIFGGFLNNSVSLSQRDFENNKTILKGNNNSVINNSFKYLTNEAYIDGFIITKGNAINGGGINNNYSCPSIANCRFIENRCFNSGAGISNENLAPSPNLFTLIVNCMFEDNIGHSNSTAVACGIGIYNSNCSAIISNCTFYHNKSIGPGWGIGIMNSGANSIITDCTFIENEESVVGFGYGGGGIKNISANSTITNCVFLRNKVSLNGGGISNQYSTAIINDCLFEDNEAPRGGGIYTFDSDSSVSITHCKFLHNKAYLGGAISNEYTNSQIRSCIFSGDSASFYGGAIYNRDGIPDINNCLFNESTADSFGAAIYNFNDYYIYNYYYETKIHVANCTFTKNKVTFNEGGTIYNAQLTSAHINNSIIWGNQSGILNMDTSASFSLAYSLIQNEPSNMLNHNLDGNIYPVFADTTLYDYQLRFDSPCINKGKNDSIPYGIIADLEGNNRITYDTVDMGAYEYKLAITLGNDTSICNNNGYALNASNNGSSYLWNTGATTQSITVNSSGTYSVEVSNIWGTVSDTVQVNVSSPPIVNLGNDTTLNQSSFIVIDAGNPGCTYLWNTGDTTQLISANSSGTYSVVVTNAVGCNSSDTIVIIMNPDGINDINTDKSKLIVSPNPSKETIYISFNNDRLLLTKAFLTDIYGRTVREILLNSKSQLLSMSGLSSGVYVLKTVTGNTVKIIKE